MFERRSHLLEGRGFTPSHRDDEVGADERHEFTGFDVGTLVDVAQGAHDDERHVAVDLELGSLATLEGILDSEGVQLEFTGEVFELVGRRILEADPQEAGLVVPSGLEFSEFVADVTTGQAFAPAVDGLVDDHGLIVLDHPARRCH